MSCYNRPMNERKTNKENQIRIGIISASNRIIAPTPEGQLVWATILNNTQVQEVKDVQVNGLSAYQTMIKAKVGKNNGRGWRFWPLSQGSMIGASSKQFKKLPKE